MSKATVHIVALLGTSIILCGCSDSTNPIRQAATGARVRNEARIKQIRENAKAVADEEEKVADEEEKKARKDDIEAARAENEAEKKAVALEQIEKKTRNKKIELQQAEIVKCNIAKEASRKVAEGVAAMADEENTRRYHDEVKRRQEAHRNLMEKFPVEQKKFKKAKAEYQANETEIAATKLLNEARIFDPKKASARKRFEEIIKTYPNTQSAEDAEMLLAGKFVPKRKAPSAIPDPIPPVAPKLKLPEEPEKVAVAYSSDEDNMIKEVTQRITALRAVEVNSEISAKARRGASKLAAEANKLAAEARKSNARIVLAAREAETQRVISDIEAETRKVISESDAEIRKEVARRDESNAATTNIFLFLGILTLCLFVYILPILIAVLRGHPQTARITIVAVFLGFTAIGWVIAFVWSLTSFPGYQASEETNPLS